MKEKDVINFYLYLKEKEQEFGENIEEASKWYINFINTMTDEQKRIYNYKNKHPEIITNYLKIKKIPKIKLNLKGNNHFCLIRDQKTNYVYLVISDINNQLQILKWSKNCNHSLNEKFNIDEIWINEIFPYIEKKDGMFEYSLGNTEKIIGEINNNKIIFKNGIYEI